MLYFLLLQVSAFLLFAGFSAGGLLETKDINVKMGDFELCDGQDANSMLFKFQEVYVTKGDDDMYTLGGVLTILEDIPELKLVIIAETCQQSYEECEFFTKLESDGCEELKKKDGYAHSMLSAAGGSTCPILKGTYKLENYKLQYQKERAEAARIIAKAWKITVEGRIDGKLVLCNVNNFEISSE